MVNHIKVMTYKMEEIKMKVNNIKDNGWMDLCYGATAFRIEEVLTGISNAAEKKGVNVKCVEDGYDPGTPEDPILRKQFTINYMDGTKDAYTNSEIACLMGKDINERIKITRFINELINDNTVYEFRVTKLNDNLQGSQISENVVLDRVGHLDTKKLRSLKYGGF